MKTSFLPQALITCLDEALESTLHPLCLVLDEEGCLLLVQGEPEYYGLQGLAEGQDVYEALPFLTGTLEGLDEPIKLEFMDMSTGVPGGRAGHVHLVPLEDSYGVVILDATEARERQQNRQQEANELALLHEQQEKLLERLEQAQRQLKEQNRKLIETSQLQSLFIGRVSHEFRTPLSIILGHVDLMKHGLLDMSNLDAIERGGKHLLALVETLLDQARLENDELVLQPTNVDLHELVEDVRQMFSVLATEKGFIFEVKYDGEIPSHVRLDGLRLRQVLINLLGNAFKYTHEGGAFLALAWQQGTLSVAVQDTGPGIPDDARTAIFEPFKQLEQNEYCRTGAGLGLAISYQLVQRMGGELSVDSQLGTGSRFHFTVDAPVVSIADGPGMENSPAILVIEADPDVRTLLEMYLLGSGYQVSVAADAAAGHAAITDHMPSLVMLDMHLPDTDLTALVQAMHEAGFSGPLVALSTANSELFRREAEALGCVAYLSKPIDPSQVMDTAAELLHI